MNNLLENPQILNEEALVAWAAEQIKALQAERAQLVDLGLEEGTVHLRAPHPHCRFRAWAHQVSRPGKKLYVKTYVQYPISLVQACKRRRRVEEIDRDVRDFEAILQNAELRPQKHKKRRPGRKVNHD